MLHRIFFIFFLLAAPFCASSQEIKFQKPKAGISQNTITSFCEDQLGFLWIGTKYGLNRYDGNRYHSFIYSSNDSLGISNSTISCLMTDAENNLWIGTNGGGLNILDVQTLKFKRAGKYKTLLAFFKKASISCIYQDSNNNFWISTNSMGTYFWNTNFDNTTFVKIHYEPVIEVFEDKLQQVWLIGMNGEICMVKHQEMSVNENYKLVQSFREAIVTRSGDLLLGGDKGLFVSNLNNLEKIELNQIQTSQSALNELVNSKNVLSLLEDSQSRIWIGTENYGLFLYDRKTNELQQFQTNTEDNLSVNSNSIWSLYEDSQQNIWVGTYKKGFNQISPNGKIFKHNLDYANLKIGGLVTGFEECDGSFWVGTDQDGLFKIDLNASKKQQVRQLDSSELDSKVITCLMTDRSGNLWAGTWEKGLFVKKRGSQTFDAMPIGENGTSSKTIKTIFEDGKGIIWISSFHKGLDRYDPQQNKFTNYQPGSIGSASQISVIMSIAEDAEGNLWFGTGGQGLIKTKFNLDGAVVETKSYMSTSNEPNSISNDLIYHLFLDSKKQLWIATNGSGLDRYNPEKDNFENFNRLDGLPSDVIYGILEDDNQQIWISTNQGLATLSFVDDEFEVKSFGVSYGLQSNEFNESACYKAADGQLYFGGVNGFNFFEPDKFSRKIIDPEVYINFLEVLGGEEKPEYKFELPKGKLNLAAGQNDISIDFATLNFDNFSKSEYAYLLENHDPDWRFTTNNNLVTYSNLRHGGYIFKVKTKKSNGEWSDKVIQLEIIIAPYWYNTKLAYLMYIILVLCLICFIFSSLINHQILTSKLQIEQIEKSKELELNNLRSQFFANITHELKTPLTLIISPLKAVENENYEIDKRQTKSMLNNAERLDRLIDQIMALSKLESGLTKLVVSKSDIVETTKNICNNFKTLAQYRSFKFELNLPDNPVHLFFEKEKMEQIIINFLSNAFKFTNEGGHISVDIKEQDEVVQLIFTDNGIGIPKEDLDLIFDRYYRGNTMIRDGSGLGLSITKQLIEMHHGNVKVYSEPAKGSSFVVNFLKGKNHFQKSQIVEEVSSAVLSDTSKQLLNELQVFSTQHDIAVANDKDELPLLLIAEDNEEIRIFIKDYLKSNFRILEAKDGVEALELAKKHIPDLIITDLMMPRMDGFTLCEKLRADEKTCHIFIGMLTVKTSEENQTKGFEKGVDFYVTKPFNPKLLALRIINILQTRQQFKSQLLEDIKFDYKPAKRQISSKDEIFLNDLMAIIEQNIDNANFNVEDLSKAMTFSKSQLYRKMKGLLGHSANEFIRIIRLKRAKQMLEEGHLNINEIAYQVGFNDLKYFRKCFKKEYGMTPSEYKKQAAN